MGRRDNMVALVTGPARGRGRAHALRLARESADTVAADHGRPRPGSHIQADVSAKPGEVGHRGSGSVR
jgi:NAD(P)-dependent dehydrogenase (short-subunit alcohol dehydrogenase family)